MEHRRKLKRLALRIVLLALLLAPTAAASATTADIAIYVVRHGWHTGVAIPRAEIPPGAWPEAAQFAQAAYVEVGWGDRDFYMSPGFNAWYAVKALLWPTPGVLHVVGLARSPEYDFRDVVQLNVTPEGLQDLLLYISASFERPSHEPAAPLGPGLYGMSAFYPSRERFHLFKTCNVWIARALRSAGLPVASSITAGAIMEQARQLSPASTAAPGFAAEDQ
jgi:uncharacterized protein (TIGR02117 family)